MSRSETDRVGVLEEGVRLSSRRSGELMGLS